MHSLFISHLSSSLPSSLSSSHRIPQDDFTVQDVKRLVGPRRVVDVMDTRTQEASTMTLSQWAKYYNSKPRQKLLNVISLEFSCTKLDPLVMPPTMVSQSHSHLSHRCTRFFWWNLAKYLSDSVWHGNSQHWSLLPGALWVPHSSYFYIIISLPATVGKLITEHMDWIWKKKKKTALKHPYHPLPSLLFTCSIYLYQWQSENAIDNDHLTITSSCVEIHPSD